MSGTVPLVGVVNSGSSSLKFSIYEKERCLLSGSVDGIGVRPISKAKNAEGEALTPPDVSRTPPGSPADALMMLLPWLREQLGGRTMAALGHRIVHGGPNHARPERVTQSLLEELTTLEPLAPLHQPHNLAPVRAVLTQMPHLPQVACFDTAFHRSIPAIAQAFAIPYDLTQSGIHRYGFHGLSYEYIASRLPDAAPLIANGRVIVAHLGNGASLCAMLSGRSMGTTMGFSALDGLPMGTRCGSLDPAVVLFLLQRGMSLEDVQDLLYRRSGLLGISGISSDFRDLLASTDSRARFALDVFVYRLVGAIGSLAATLGGLDGLVFTAGVGENAAPIRATVCQACQWLGIELDMAANTEHRSCISLPNSRVKVHVIPTDENLMIARHTHAVLGL